jgi:putative spermidine/putrescine transport system ATP-binding protein
MTIVEGEFFAMLGPSGSGKTTCLRLIAGFDQPTGGHIEIFGETAEGVPPYRRNVNTVFQDYALFPHLKVLDNVAYGLMIKGVGRQERHRQAREALALVKLGGMESRWPAELSGGQRQRAALARALVNRPKVLLLDEPLGALDLKLREQMQVELKALQQQLGITFIFVTHDQGEALSMADRIAIFDQGHLVQLGSPREVYERPQTRFVADFVGSSNVLDPDFSARHFGKRNWTSLRPESVRLSPVRNGGLAGTVTGVQYQGPVMRVAVDVEGTLLHATIPTSDIGAKPGDSVSLSAGSPTSSTATRISFSSCSSSRRSSGSASSMSAHSSRCSRTASSASTTSPA